MRKKGLWMLLLSMVLVLVACGSQNATSGSGADSGSENAGNGEEVTIIMTNEIAEDHPNTKLMRKFAEEIEKRSEGRIKAELYPGGQLYNDLDALRALGTGSVHMVWPVSVQLENFNPAYGVISLPFVIADEKMQDDTYRQQILDLLSPLVEENGIKVLGLTRTTDGMFISNSKKLESVEDLKGLKIRMTGGQVLLENAKALGASAISMPASEMTTALSQGAIDAVLSSPAGWLTILGDTGKYALHAPGMWIGTYSIVVDKKWFEALPTEYQELITSTIDELAKTQWSDNMKTEQEEVERIQNELGGKIVTLEGDDLEAVKAALQPVHDKFASKHPEVYEQLQQILQQ